MFAAHDERPWRVTVRKYLPEALGGIRFHDRLVRKTKKTFNDPHRVWESIHQDVINDIFNQGAEREWTGLPILNQVDCPCDPGCVLLVGPRSCKTRMRIQPDRGCLVGTYHDFLPPGVYDRSICMKLPVVKSLRRHHERRVYQCRNSENAVIVTMVLQDMSDIEHTLKPDNTYIVLDNFDGTFFSVDYCYIVSRVIIAESVTIETTMNGTDYYEARYTAPTAVCFQAMKVKIQNPLTGSVSSIKPEEHPLFVKLNRRRRYQHFINVFAPNQCRLGMDVGDCPAIITNFTGPPVLRSVRPLFLPRPDRVCRFGVYYHTNVNERNRILEVLRQGGIPEILSNANNVLRSSAEESETSVDTSDASESDEDDAVSCRNDDVIRRAAGKVDGRMMPSSDDSCTSVSSTDSVKTSEKTVMQNDVTSGSVDALSDDSEMSVEDDGNNVTVETLSDYDGDDDDDDDETDDDDDDDDDDDEDEEEEEEEDDDLC